MRKSVGLFIVLCLMPALAAWTDNVSLLQKMENDARCQQWVDSVMRTLSLKERIGQLMVYTIAPTQDKANVDLLRKVVREYKIGGLLFSILALIFVMPIFMPLRPASASGRHTVKGSFRTSP